MPTATVARLNVTPVKGTRLAHPSTAELTPQGIPGNRRFFLVDERGNLASCTDVGGLMPVAADWDARREMLAVTLPDGRRVEAASDRLGGAHVTDFDGKPVPGRFVEGPIAGALSEALGQPVRLVRADREGDGPDVHPVTLVGLASVRDLGSRHGRPDLDPRRFRMNLELDGLAPFEEEGWSGRHIRAGGAVLAVLGQVPRCVATTRDPATGDRDFDTLRYLAAYRPLMAAPRGVPFGMYAQVVVPGTLSVGDPVEPLAER
jgi:hypothetical protein